MKVSIDDNAIKLLRALLEESKKSVVRISKKGIGCGGIDLEIIMDDQKESDDYADYKDFRIVADKSISFYFTDAVITYKDGINGPRLKLTSK